KLGYKVQYESCHGNNLKEPNLKTKWLTAGLLYRTKLLLNSSKKITSLEKMQKTKTPRKLHKCG
ncbi:hypothetical protein, partial [Klebsiella pneumoniae]|uniref:hypothetical protein n=1 Tax=Klebsiella pneumoniae TaxID=573 RepID=UPI0024DEBA9C